MNELEQLVESAFSTENWVNVRTLVAVSGGPDSVAVLRAMVALGQLSDQPKTGNLIVAHVNHATRGSESDADARFVRELAGQLGLEFHQSDARPMEQNDLSEESLRNFRYSQLVELAHRIGARYIVTGHNLDDQVETILFRIFRGTGISGLAGIPQQRLVGETVTIVRPLLAISRGEIENYLSQIDQLHCSDSSNEDSKYTRNYLRNLLIPELKSRFGETVCESICRLGKQAQETDAFLMEETKGLAAAIVSRSDNHVELDGEQLRQLPPLVVRHFISQIWSEQNWPRQAMTFKWWQKIAEVVQGTDAPVAKTVLNLPRNVHLERQGHRIRISK